MPSTRSRGEPLTPYNPKLSKTLRKMENQGVHNNPIIDEHEDEINNKNAQVRGGNLLRDALRVLNPLEQRLRDNNTVEVYTVESEGTSVLPHVPLGHTFFVTSSLM